MSPPLVTFEGKEIMMLLNKANISTANSDETYSVSHDQSSFFLSLLYCFNITAASGYTIKSLLHD